MKIAVVGTRGFPGIQGGVEKHCEKLFTHLAGKGCDVTVFSRKPYVTYKHSEYEGVHLVPVECPRNKFLEALVHTFICILKAKKLHPDILHIHAIGPSLFTPLAKSLGMKVVVTHHGPDYMRKKWSLPAKLFLKFCERIGMTSADGIIAISKNISEDIKDRFKRTAVVLPNGIDAPDITHTEETLIKFGLQKEKYILAVGRFVPEKGFHDLLSAYAIGRFGDLKLVIAGSADHEDNYSLSLKKMAGQTHGVVLTGLLTEQSLRELYSHAALFVIPSYYEGLPIVLLEALSYGIKCIASDIPSNRNIQLNDDRFFKPGDIKSLAAKIREIVDLKWNDQDRQNQIKMIYNSYNWKLIAEKTLKFYNNLVLCN